MCSSDLERIFDDLNNGFGWDRLPKSFMAENTVFLLLTALVFLIQFFMTITLAYLAVSVCSTILQTKKIKGFISFVLFIVFYVILSVIASKIPHLSNPGPDATFMEAMYAMIPQIALYFVVMVASYIGSSVLLEKKISL